MFPSHATSPLAIRLARRTAVLGLLIGVPALLSGCGDDPKVISLDVNVGKETTAMTEAPPITELTISAFDVAGERVAQSTAVPGGDFTLGEADVSQLLRFEVEGFDASGNSRLAGGTISVLLGAVNSEVLPIFAQRRRTWSRPPGELSQPRINAVSTAVGERYVILGGGEDADGMPKRQLLFYDLLALAGVDGGTLLALVPTVMVPSSDGSAALMVGDSDKATLVDFDGGTAATIPSANGWSFAEASHGRVVLGPDGITFLVGAARADQSSDLVLVIAADRTIGAVRLKHPRKGAAVGYATGRGLVVAGGTDQGPGVELLAPDADAFVTLPFAPDATEGAALVTGRTEAEVALIGGDVVAPMTPLRLVNLDCVSQCEVLAVPTALPPLAASQAFRLGDTTLVVGTGTAMMETWEVSLADGSTTERPLREPRTGATVTPTPLGSLMIAGGRRLDGTPALCVESFFP